MTIKRVSGIILSLGLLACAEDPTQLLVVVDSDMSVPQDLVQVQATVRSENGRLLASSDFALVANRSEESRTRFSLPLSFGVLAPTETRTERVMVDVSALGTSTTGQPSVLFTRQALTGFVEGKSLVLPMYLASQCQTLQCGTGQTCTEKGCVSERVDETALAESQGDDTDLVIVSVPSPDAGPGAADAGSVAKDAAPDMDAAPGMDAAPDMDAGSVAKDADPAMDASFVADADPAMDAAEPVDSGEIPDSGVSMDAAPADTGVSTDGGVFVQTSPVAMNWVYSGPASLYFNQTEVTVAQYEACVTAGSCTSSNHGTSSSDCNYGDASRNDHPMNCVNWHGATEFCAWVGARLPDENEWYAEASNGGTRLYPWGDTPLASCTHCVMDDPSAGGNGCGNESTMPVGSKPLGDSVSGVSDLSGNAWEWTTTPSGSARVVRGGSWINVNQSYLQTSARSSDYPDDRHVSGVGFRCVSVSAP